jgi:hypothetical protein
MMYAIAGGASTTMLNDVRNCWWSIHNHQPKNKNGFNDPAIYLDVDAAAAAQLPGLLCSAK